MNQNVSNPSQKPGSTRKLPWKTLIAVIILIALIVIGRYYHLHDRLKDALVWISDLGPIGMLIFLGLYVAATVLFLPGSILTLGAGVLYGVVKGTILVSISSTLGATVAFLIGRYLARDWVARKIERNNKFKAMDDAVAREGWKIVLLTRLSPIFPFNLLNYAFGLTRVRLKHYFLASWLGMLPGTLMYVYIGSLAGNLTGLSTGTRQRTTIEWVLYGIGLLATIGVTYVITRMARQALSQHVESTAEVSAESVKS